MVSNNLHVLKQQTPKKSSGPIQNSIIHAPIQHQESNKFETEEKIKPVLYPVNKILIKIPNITMSTPFITSTGSKATNQKWYNYDLYRSMWKKKFVACTVQYQQPAG